jgi:predicted alpha/beta hydrolase family esterase
MRTSDVDILIVPGWSSSGPDHWQTRWERNLKTARRVDQEDWFRPDKDKWVGKIISAVAAATRPAVLVAHSVGVPAVVHAAQKMPSGLVAGAFLVAPADVENAAGWPDTQGHIWKGAGNGEAGFVPVPREKLTFPSALVASATDPYCSLERAAEFAGQWGSRLIEAGDAGHINAESGHGPWPDGLLQFGGFLKSLG